MIESRRIAFEVFDEYGKRRITALLDKREKFFIVAGFIDYFGDAELAFCSECGVPVFVRPWLKELIDLHNLLVVCICCADPLDIKCQITMDLAKIQSQLKDKREL